MGKNVRQVCYVPHLDLRINKCNRYVTIKIKPRIYVEIDDIDNEKPFQVDETTHVDKSVGVEVITTICDSTQRVDLSNLPILNENMDEYFEGDSSKNLDELDVEDEKYDFNDDNNDK